MGRKLVAGRCLRRDLRWWLVEEIKPGPHQLYLGYLRQEINVLGCQSIQPALTTTHFAYPNPLNNPLNLELKNYLSTRHCLENLQKIIPCKPRYSNSITGVLFQYLDGHQESAGEVRLDALAEPLYLESNGEWSLVFVREYGRIPFLSLLLAGRYQAGTNELVINLA
jgi:hypothetical protein